MSVVAVLLKKKGFAAEKRLAWRLFIVRLRSSGCRVVRAISPTFFYSSRRRHTSCGRAWSSDVCSSDLVALGRHEEFKLHLRAAIEHGVPKDDVKEVLLQAAIYCGVPAANTAFHLAEE